METIMWKYYKSPEYDAVVELVKMLRGLGIPMYIKECPKCGAEGSVSVVKVRGGGYSYVVIRHRDKRTHVVPKQKLELVLKELCEVKKDLEYVLNQYKKYEESGIKFCAEGGQ
jgi:recombinational DNA repair protein (RecF pathway)